jgi:FkbM family methyltransferase
LVSLPSHPGGDILMMTNTKTLFSAILKARRADGVCDIGSRDGMQSLLFRHLLPSAAVIAFEANPINFKAMQADARLAGQRIDLFPHAVSNQRGTAQFHVADVDYTDPGANRGTSSLLLADGQKVKETVQVETYRIDDFILERYPALQRVGLWIDVEGAEYAVLEGIIGIKDKIVAVHLETTNEPRWIGQRPLRDIVAFMSAQGFSLCARNFGLGASEWGDVVFIRENVAHQMGWRLAVCKFKARLGYILRADNAAVLLKNRVPWLYRFCRWLYIRLGM